MATDNAQTAITAITTFNPIIKNLLHELKFCENLLGDIFFVVRACSARQLSGMPAANVCSVYKEERRRFDPWYVSTFFHTNLNYDNEWIYHLLLLRLNWHEWRRQGHYDIDTRQDHNCLFWWVRSFLLPNIRSNTLKTWPCYS